MKKSIFLSVIFSLEILFSVTKIQANWKNNLSKFGFAIGITGILYGLHQLRKEKPKNLFADDCPPLCPNKEKYCEINHPSNEYWQYKNEIEIPGKISLGVGMAITLISILYIVKK